MKYRVAGVEIGIADTRRKVRHFEIEWEGGKCARLVDPRCFPSLTVVLPWYRAARQNMRLASETAKKGRRRA